MTISHVWLANYSCIHGYHPILYIVEPPLSANNQSPEIILEKNGNLNLYWVATSNKACIQTLFYFSFRSFQKRRQARSARKKNKERPSIFFFPHSYPLALGVNKSPEVYIFYSLCTERPLPSEKIGDRAPSPSFYWGWGGGGSVHRLYFLSRALDGLWRENGGSVNRLEKVVEKNGKLYLYWAATSIKRSRPPFCRSNNSFSIVVNSIKLPSRTWRTKFGFILRIWWRQSEIEGDDRSWTSNAAPVACSF